VRLREQGTLNTSGLLFGLQATLFYAPRWLWKNWEGGKLHALSKDLRVGYLSKEEKAEKRKMLVDYLQENLNNHGGWAGRYMLCEVLALVNVIGAFTLPTPSCGRASADTATDFSHVILFFTLGIQASVSFK
jgi:hypothetical protein